VGIKEIEEDKFLSMGGTHNSIKTLMVHTSHTSWHRPKNSRTRNYKVLKDVGHHIYLYQTKGKWALLPHGSLSMPFAW